MLNACYRHADTQESSVQCGINYFHCIHLDNYEMLDDR